VVALVWFCRLGKGEDFESQGDGLAKTADLSATGVGFDANESITTGEKIFLEISVTKASISCVGQVVYCRPLPGGRFRIGVHFLVMPPNDRFIFRTHFTRRGKS
jgi:hypothetical protein